MNKVKHNFMPIPEVLPYSSRRVYLPVKHPDHPEHEVLVLSRAVYHRDPISGRLTRVGKPLNKKDRKRLGVAK